MGTVTVKRIYLKHQTFVKIFFKTSLAVEHPFEMRYNWSFILSNVLTSFTGSAWATHSYMLGYFFKRAVAAIHSFRGYMKQVIFYSIYFFGRPILGIRIFKMVYLFRHSNHSHPSNSVCFCHGCHPFSLRVLYLFWRENLHSSIIWVFL